MPRTREQNEKIREERRAEILTAATDLFAKDGFADTSVSAVAKAAGVSHGTVFLYFPTKEELFRSAVLERLLSWEARYMQVLSADGSPLERIERFVRQQVRDVAAQESYVRLVHYVLGLRSRFPDLAQQIFGFSSRQMAALSPIIAEGQALGQIAPGDPRGIAVTYFAWLNGAPLVYLTPPDDPTWEYAVGFAMRIFSPMYSSATKPGGA
ncbi:MAG: transcriptional regulator, TetR family [Symbiobacteriaceae bacterium]|jgi:AcrR family transcriptional regulator|nr:transcriptional regulator, TetR family [Symbiobacteriaceae bacterium]